MQKDPIRETLEQIANKMETFPISRELPTEFESDFQNGNLFQVFKKSKNYYIIILKNDPTSKPKSGWFFFGVKNLPKN